MPDDPRLPAEIRGTTISGLYVIKDATRPNVDDYRTYVKNYGDYKETYTRRRLQRELADGKRRHIGGGMTYGDAHINDCFVVDDPTQLRFCDRDSRSELRPGARRSAGQAARRLSASSAAGS